MGIGIPGAKPRLPSTEEAAEESESEGEEGEEGEGGAGRGGEAADLGAARPKGETAEAKRERKDAAKALKQARRHPNP